MVEEGGNYCLSYSQPDWAYSDRAMLNFSLYFFRGKYFSYFGLFWGPLGSLGALVGAKWWGKVVGFDCFILSQIGLILTELCWFFISYFSWCLK